MEDYYGYDDGSKAGDDGYYEPPPTDSQEGPYGISFWLARGFTTDDMFDQNGQLRPGWRHTAEGYMWDGGAPGQLPPAQPAAPTTPTGRRPRADVEREGREYDARNGLIGGYYDERTGMWVSGSPRGSGGGDYRNSGGISAGTAGAPGQYPFPTLDLPTFEDDLGDYVPETWNAPDPKTIYDDPSYQFRFDEGLRPIRNDRAMQGLTRTGATMKQLTRYGQGFASNEYDRIYDRAADSYDRRNTTRFTAHQANRQARLDRYDRRVGELTGEFAPRQRWAELQFQRDWDLYKYLNDDEFRRWQQTGEWASRGSQPPPNP